MTLLQDFTLQCRQRVDNTLEQQLPATNNTNTEGQLAEAMRYSTLNGGKRVRPILAYGAAHVFLGEQAFNPAIDFTAASLELIHAYSLIHDDLPAMDDDDLRRGRPTCHIAFNDATAILAGDSLQPLAFELLTEAAELSAETRIALVKELSAASGTFGMVGGQALDLAATDQEIDLAGLEKIHRNKTGALIRAAVRMGALASEQVSDDQLIALTTYAEAIGLAFQVQDDILDVTADTETLGKQQGADEALNKATYVRLLGLEAAQTKAEQLLEEALTSLRGFDHRAEPLRELARYIVNRNH
ncbi:MAG: (2E,6E)-farnesyl diphosphate synthase [Cellvibrionaceae bacterium]